MICHLRIGDGRDDVHERAHASITEMLPQPDHIVIVDDKDHELGFAGAIAKGWKQVAETKAEWVVHLEMDFLFHSPVPVEQMIAVLKRQPKLAQLSLKRQPCNHREKASGGIVEADADDFTQVTEGGDIWTEHRRYWTTNPSVYSANWCLHPWPQESESEGKFTHRLLEDPDLRFGIWGAKYDPPLVEHIGERIGVGY